MPRPRSAAAAALLVVGVLLLPAGVVAAWARGLVVDTDRFVRTLAPLVEDEAIRSSVADRATRALLDALDLPALADELVDAAITGLGAQTEGRDAPRLEAALRALAVAAVAEIEGLVGRTVSHVIDSPAFADAWERACRRVHRVVTAVLRDDADVGALMRGDGTVVVDVSPALRAAADRLAARGLDIRAPEPLGLEVLSEEQLLRVRGWYRFVDVGGRVAPAACILVLAGGVLLTHRGRRRRAALVTALASAGATLVTLAGIVAVRAVYVDATAAPAAAATALFDQVVSLLQLRLWGTVGVAAAAAVVAALLGRVRVGPAGLGRLVPRHPGVRRPDAPGDPSGDDPVPGDGSST